jgi:hypothetical protein
MEQQNVTTRANAGVKGRQPWIYNARVDSLFVLLPPFLALGAVVLLPGYFRPDAELSVAAWVVLVLGVDVAHVYSTLYRTYFDPDTFQRQKSLLLTLPLLGWMAGVMLYSVDGLLFWRVLAYVAVFHFIRQQYGFLRIYSRGEPQPLLFARIDTVAVYAAALYPILFWHLHPDRRFEWFVPGDFLQFRSAGLVATATTAYVLVIAAYAAKEAVLVVRQRRVNVPRNLLVAGTFVSWFFGIVYYNGDLIFTTLNVVSHGIPYMALVWVYGRKKYHDTPAPRVSRLWQRVFSNGGVALFLLIVLGLAFLEEGFWDALVWRDHERVFAPFRTLPRVTDHTLLSFLVPTLAVPQLTHYLLDGFIWKLSKDAFHWRKVTLG